MFLIVPRPSSRFSGRNDCQGVARWGVLPGRYFLKCWGFGCWMVFDSGWAKKELEVWNMRKFMFGKGKWVKVLKDGAEFLVVADVKWSMKRDELIIGSSSFRDWTLCEKVVSGSTSPFSQKQNSTSGDIAGGRRNMSQLPNPSQYFISLNYR